MTPSARRPPRRGPGRAGSRAERTTAGAAPADAVALAIAGVLLALLAARAILTFVPSMALWSLNLQRFMPAPAAWLGWGACAIALVPAVARVLAPALAAGGDRLRRSAVLAPLALAVLAAALVWMMPDRLHYTGDFNLRYGAIMKGESPVLSSPQIFPLDELLHYTLPRALMTRFGMSVDHAVLAVGAIGAASLAWAAWAFARALAVGGVAAAVAAAIVLFGGHLALFTGESKAFAELVILFVVYAAAALRVVRDGTGLVWLGVALALALPLHRYALGLLPAFLVAWALWLRAHRGTLASRWLTIAAAALPPLVAIAIMAPRLLTTATGFDVGANFLTARVSQRGILGEALSPLRLLDLANLVLVLSPLALTLPVLAVARRGMPRVREAAMLLAVALPFVAVMLITHPPGGLLRYWDVFAPAGIGCSMLAAWAIARALDAPHRAWLAPAVVAAALVPSLQWLDQFTDPRRGAARIETLMTEPPRRSADDVWSHWDLLGWRAFERGDMPEAARAWRHAAEAAPTPHTLVQWGMAESAQGHRDVARDLYRQSVARDSALILGWIGVAVEAIAFQDHAETEEAARHLQRLAPDNAKTLEILEYLRTVRAPGTP